MTDEITPDPPATEGPEVSVQPSILGELRKAREGIGAGAEPIDITIPGYGGKLVVAFKWVPYAQLSATAKQLAKIKEPTEQAVAAAADALVATCDEVKVNIDGALQPLSTNGVPITFSDGERLAFALGFPVPDSARLTCYAVFSNEYALIDVAQKVTTWLEDTSQQVDGDFLGN